MSNISLPNQVFSAPYPGPRPPFHQPGHSTYNTFNPQPVSHLTQPTSQPQYQQPQQQPQQQSQTQRGNMGPPSRPVDNNRPTDLNELSDVLMGAGVDLREEEAALLSRQNQDNALNLYGPGGSVSATNPNYTPFNTYSRNVPGGADTFFGAGSFNQPVAPYKSAEEMAEAERKSGQRRKKETGQYHLNNPFLLLGKIQKKMTTKARNERVEVPRQGLYQPQAHREVKTIVYGPDKHEKLVVLKDQDLLNHDTPLGDILALLSLAAEERMRGLIEDAAALAKGRRTTSHGIVPIELRNLAEMNGSTETATGLPTPDNSAVSPKANPLKRSYSEVNKPPTPVSNGSRTPTIKPSLPALNPVTTTLRNSYLAERKAEEKRLAKRARRTAAASASADTVMENGASSNSASGAATPSSDPTAGKIAPDIDAKKILSKKEQKKQADLRVSEAAAVAHTNNALSMSIGGRKMPSWLTGGKPAGNTNPMLPRVNTSANANTATNANPTGSGLVGARRFDFREDAAKGVRIQLRDLLFVMDSDQDRKEKRALARAWGRLKDER
ncbi:MAG: hypothetical protein LQ350_004975 [Teloschistes chrysophthalmus]|nr:MAG: hypothetical protein LQ350_004975 [Niorma chrysophthalma]